ncbi:dihydropteroate synthase [Rhodococcus rhodnii]|uniref:Dihydropteroate synthase n=2 Tax=Rhodococcus rhodnii TaxID=38312 RepID=R7WSJ9_9NOCA|nr:dihydropteroate synthase [Rhodococcus rhodnii]EOM78270.1 dihydropteroate synthase [Rhodococcus rhodnii LMG 5362]TXG89281.1 dihydropteroate synthase [Rhodococcus rhodnii]
MTAPVPIPTPGRTLVMGILNVTSDSFSDGGRYLDRDAALAHGLALRDAGVDIVDVGGESTRPGADRVDPAVEAERVAPTIRDLVAEGICVSVDTMRASVAQAALEAGATIVNDVSGGRADTDMVRVVADARAPWILMHWRSAADHIHRGTAEHYDDVVADVSNELLAQVDLATAGGVDPASIILDPGLGFAKNAQHNWELLAALPHFVDLGFPVLIGASRKRFLGSLLGGETPPPPTDRDVATASVSALAAAKGAWGVRVHNAPATLDAIAVAHAWRDAETRRGARDVDT